MFDWLKNQLKRIRQPKHWIVNVDEAAIHATDYTGVSASILKSELSTVVIETNDTGPLASDVWWMLYDSSNQLGSAFPHDADGAQMAIDYLMTHEGFNHAEMITAMGSTANAKFLVLERPA